ncbi:DinB family protein [bacterium]|nr:MAG: DinB family protein [bacterium]
MIAPEAGTSTMLIDAEPLAGYREPYGLLCAILKDGTNEWRWEIDPDLKEDAVVWQPYPDTHSIGAIIFHIIGTEIFWFERLVLGLPGDPEERKLLLSDEIDMDAWKWPEPTRKPISWYFELHDRVRARTLEGIKDWPAPDARLEHHGREVTPRWVLGHVIQHEAYHGGQAVLLSRLWHLKTVNEASQSS